MNTLVLAYPIKHFVVLCCSVVFDDVAEFRIGLCGVDYFYGSFVRFNHILWPWPEDVLTVRKKVECTQSLNLTTHTERASYRHEEYEHFRVVALTVVFKITKEFLVQGSKFFVKSKTIMNK